MGRKKIDEILGTRFSAIYAILLVSFFVFPLISAAVMYQPGETLDPGCAPTDLNCGVYPSVSLTTSTYAVGDMLYASSTSEFALLHRGTNGQFLKATATGIAWDNIPGGGDLLASNDLSDVASTTLARANLGLEIGADVQAYNAGLSSIAGLSFATSTFIVGTESGWESQSSSTVKTTLGLGNVENTALSTWGGSLNITSLGTIGAGTWQGSTIASGYLGLNVMLEGENISLLNNDSNFITSSTARTSISENVLGLSYDNVSGVFSLDGSYNIPLTASTTNWQSAFSWGNHASAGYLTSYTESDPIWTAVSSTYLATTTAASTYLSQANAVSIYLSLADWNATTTDALTEGDVNKYYSDTLARNALSFSGLGLTYNSGTGVLSVSSTYNIPLTASTTAWNTFYDTPSTTIALGTGLAWNSNTIQAASGYNIPLTASTTNWQSAFSWGNHASAGYLTSYTESDPIWMAASSTYLATTTAASTYLSQANAASTYLTQANAVSTYLSLADWNTTTTDALAEGDTNKYFSNTLARGAISFSGLGLAYDNSTGVISVSSTYNIPLTASTTNWQSAFSWGNHASAGYLTSYTESDPIWTAASSSYLTTSNASNTYLAIANNLSDLNSSSTARTNLGLVVGTDVQAYNVGLSNIAGLTISEDAFIVGKSGAWVAETGVTARTSLGLGSVEDTALSSWTGNTFISSVGTIATGTWQGDVIASGYLGLNVMLEGENISLLSNNSNFVDASGARTAISFSGLGLDYNNSTGVLSVSSTYNIPLTASTTNWNTAYNTVTASSSDWQSAFSWGNHASAGYLVAASNLSDLQSSSTARTNLGLGTLALQNLDGVAITGGSINGTTIGASTPSTAVFTNATSTNFSYSGELDTPFTQGSVVFAGANGVLSEANSTLFWDGRLGIGTNTFQVTTTPILEVQGVSELKSRVIAGRDVTLTGWQTVYSMWAFNNERPVIAKNNTTGKIGYLAEGGTQGLFMGTAGRSIVFDGRTQVGTEKFTASSGYGLVHLDGVADFNNAAVTYRGFQYNFIDSASAEGSLILDLQKSGTSQFVVRKDGNVGINTSTPGYKLTIAGVTGATENALYITPSSDGTSERASLALDNWEVGQDYNASGIKDFYIKDTASSTARFFIDKQGNVGVGTTTPQSAFHLNSGSFTQTVGSDPTIVGTFTSTTALNGINSLAVAGKYAYVTSYTDDSLRILDISKSSSPTLVGGVSSGTSLNGARGVAVAGKYAYVVSYLDDSLRVIDVSNPTSPTIVGGVSSSTVLNGAQSIFVAGKYAYVASNADNSLRIIDISDPITPVIVGGIKDDTNLYTISSVYVVGRYAYVTNMLNDSFRIIDISVPTSPIILGGIQDHTNLVWASSVYVSGKYAYVASPGAASLEVIDVSNPSSPTIVSGVTDLSKLDGANSVYVAGKYAYVASNIDNSLRILDISNPTATPVFVGVVKDATNLSGASVVSVSGKYAYVVNGTGKSLAIINLTGIDAPTANIGALEASTVRVIDDFNVNNNAYVGSGLNVGGDSLFGGAMSVSGGLTLTDATSSLSNNIDFNFVNTSTSKWTLRLNNSNNNFYIVDNTGTNGVYMQQGDTAWTGTSDQRLKDNIMSLNVLDRIDNYRAVSFDWKSSGKHDIGAIAQELYAIFPEAVSVGKDDLGKDNEGAWGIQYSKLGALALEGVKELKQELDSYNALLLGGSVGDFVSQAGENNTMSFAKDVSFAKHVSFSKDTVGSALIQAGEDGVLVRFDMPYDTPPIVNLTLASDVILDSYFVDAVDTESFTIRIRPSVAQDVVINWSAFGQVSPSTLISQPDTSTSGSSSSGTPDSLTDLANNYLTDNGLTLDETNGTTTTTSTISEEEPLVDSTTSTSSVEVVVPLEEEIPVSSSTSTI